MDKRIEEFSKKVKNIVADFDMDPDNQQASLDKLLLAVEELQVADEELRAQNEELEAAFGQINRERQRYLNLFRMAPEAYLVTDSVGTIREANDAASELFGIRQDFLVGKPLAARLAQGEDRSFRRLLSKLDMPIEATLQFKRKEQGDVIASVRVAPLFSSAGVQVGFLWMLRDETEKLRMHASVQRSEERFHTLFAQVQTGIALLDGPDHCVDSNPALQQLLGRAAAELLGANLADYAHPQDRPLLKQNLAEVFGSQEAAQPLEMRFVRPDGSLIWGSVSINHLQLSRVNEPLVVVLVHDISAAKRIVEERNEMQRQLFDSLEAERARLARELHDHPLQDLYGVIYQMANLDPRVVNEHQDDLAEIRDRLQNMINTIRQVCGELRPPSLNQFGLEKALRAYVNNINTRARVVNFNLVLDQDPPELNERTSLAVYRIFQEAMANVQRHSEADQVDIQLSYPNGELDLQVRDNGQGFRLPENLVELMQAGHYGLAGMTERVQAINGRLEVRSQPGQGTTVQVNVPLG